MHFMRLLLGLVTMQICSDLCLPRCAMSGSFCVEAAVEAAMKRHEASLEASWRFIAIYSCLFRAWTSISALLCTCQR